MLSALPRPVAALLLVSMVTACSARAQRPLPEMLATTPNVSIRDGDVLRPNAWRLVPEANPDVYEAPLVDGKPLRITFISETDSIGFLVEEGKQYDFIVRKDGIPHYTRIVGKRFIPMAVFDSAYRVANRGRIKIEIPEAYELVNIAIALTPMAIADRGLVYKNSPYYAQMRQWFDPYAAHPLIARLDSALRQGGYFNLKMNGRAFEFDSAGRLVKSRVFDRTGGRTNALEPYAAALDDFARVSGFRRFYAEHRALYAEQIAFYRDSAGIPAMQRWLNAQFPGARPYDSYDIVFSPLVAYNQSTTWYESNGFKVLQPHVNFPYVADLRRAGRPNLSDSAARLVRGNIVFTEINHGYINPEAARYAARIDRATSDHYYWVDSAMGPGYYAGIATFNEYMNWVLVNLRLAEAAPPAEGAALIAGVEQMMVRNRSFPRFAEFSEFLVPLYLNRGKGRALADLYPEIITWFEEHGPNGAATRGGSAAGQRAS